MKKIFFLILAAYCITAIAYAAGESDQGYGLGAPEHNARMDTPVNFDFDINNYDKIYAGGGYNISAERVDPRYCIDVTYYMNSANDMIIKDRGPAGNLMYTSDVYLQDAGFYTFSNNGKVGKTETEISNNIDESSQHLNKQTIRKEKANGQYFYIGVEPNDKSYNGLSDSMRSQYEKRLFMNGPKGNNFSRVDLYSDSGYEMQNIEYIAYFDSKPFVDDPNNTIHAYNQIIGQYDNSTSVGAWGMQWQPRLLGCYAVQQVEGGVNASDVNHPISFLWLVHYNVKMQYPVMRVSISSLVARKIGLFSGGVKSYGDHVFWSSMTETFVK